MLRFIAQAKCATWGRLKMAMTFPLYYMNYRCATLSDCLEINTRCGTFAEGEKVLKSRHIVVGGTQAIIRGTESTTMVGVCSSMRPPKPHVVNVVVTLP